MEGWPENATSLDPVGIPYRANHRSYTGAMSRWLCALLIVVGLQTGLARPAQIILLRHAEKPPDDADVHLSERGFERAQALVPFLTTNAVFRTNGLPAALFAPKFTRRGHSRRPYETLEPLASHLKLPIQTPYGTEDYRPLARRLLADPACDGKTVVVCWVHDCLPELARELGATLKAKRWKDRVYDRVWLLTLQGEHVSLTSLPQRLLPGDSTN